MKHLFSILLTGALLVFAALPAHAYVGLCCVKCGGNMPMNIPGGGIPETHEFRIKLTPTVMRMDGLQSGTSSLDPSTLLGMPGMGKYMAVPSTMDMKMLNLSAGYSFSDRFFGGVMFMYTDKQMDMTFNSTMAGVTGQPGFTMESSGFADTMIMTKYRLFADDPLGPTRQASLLMGLSLPTGPIDEQNSTHPLGMRQTELLPYGMQLGSGTFDPTVGLLYQAATSPWWWGANLTGTFRLHDNKRDYRLGNRYALDLYAMRQIRHDLLWQAQANYAWQGDIGGVMDEFASGASGHSTKNDPTSIAMTPLWRTDAYGGSKAFLTGGIQWQPVPLQIMDLTVQAPIYQNLNGPQLADDWRVMLTWYMEMPTKKSVRHPDHVPTPAPSQLGF
ncbi:MAG: hypothetical protein ACE5FN_07290 [Leptospirillia bacterium]